MSASNPELLTGLIGGLAPEGAPVALSRAPLEAPVERALLAAARVAPSADNAQTWRFVSVHAAETRLRLADAVPPALAPTLQRAPLVLAVCGVKWLLKRARREQPFVMLDVPIAVTHLLLQAAELGLACAWTLSCDEAAVRSELQIPDDVRVVALLALGWPEASC
jgi:nitroreductase